MNIFTPAFWWFLSGTGIVFIGTLVLTSAEYADDDAALWGWLLIGFGALGCLVGVIAKGVEAGLDGARQREHANVKSDTATIES